MRIALINPKKNLIGDKDFISLFDNVSKKYLFRPKFSGFGLGLLIIAALTPSNYNIEIIDENFDLIPWDNQYDLIGITANTSQVIRAYEIADEFKRRSSSTVVIGGIHATVLADEAKKHADSVVVGEAERQWPKLLEDFKNNKLKHFYRETQSIDLQLSPIPRYDLLKRENYNIIWVQTTRGCPHNCEFCASSRVYGQKYRKKNIEQIIEEIKLIKSIWDRPQISFADDNMFVDKNYSTILLNKLKKLNIRYFAQADMSVAKNKKFLKILKASGCTILFIGLETLSIEGLKQINKNKRKASYLKNYEKYIERIQAIGIGVMGAFIIGLDTDDISIFDKIAEFIIKNNLYAAQITVLTPIPGSSLRERLLAENRIIDSNDWKRYSFSEINFIPKNMTSKQLKDGYLAIHKKIYSIEVNKKRMNFFKNIYKYKQ